MTEGPPRKTRLEVFVSYANEDAELMREITDELKKSFSYLLNFFVDSQSIRQGANWKPVINAKLDEADILLMISTGQQRESFDFTGYEMGYFSRSIQGRSANDGTGRHIIPLVILGATPTAVQDVQAVIVNPEITTKDILSVTSEDLSCERKFLERLKENDPFGKMLDQLRLAATKTSNLELSPAELKDLEQKVDQCAPALGKKVFKYLQSRVSTETFPERKIIIRTAMGPLLADGEQVLANSTIEFVGRSFEIFNLAPRPPQLSWQAFIDANSEAEMAIQLKEGIRTLVSGALSGMPSDNYYFVSSLISEQSFPVFRLFVSLTRTFYSGQREIHIYIVKVAPAKDYGDLKTTKLMKAVAIGLRYRSMFLEHGSPFSPDIMGFYHGKDIRSKAAELWNELQHILAVAQQERLDDPILLSYIYGPSGHGRLDQLVVIWHDAEANLNKITNALAAAAEDKIDEMKSNFMDGLKVFCDKTEEMNREFTSKALRALEAEITLKLADYAGNASTSPKAVSA
jgi:hypothetical protein